MEEAPSTTPAFAFLEAQLQRLAGHLTFVSTDRAFLEPLARALVGDAVTDPPALRARLLEVDQRLERTLAALGPVFPLSALVASHRLSRIESDLLFFALLPELDDRFGDVLQALRVGLPSRRPTLGIALRALLDARADRWHARQHLLGSVLWEAGLLRREADDTPGLDTVLVPSAPVSAAAHGHLPERLDGGAGVDLLPDAGGDAPPPPRVGAAARLSRWIEAVQTGVVHLVSEVPDDARAVAALVAASFGRPLLRFSRLGPSPEAALRQAALCGAISPALQLIEVERGVDVLRVPASWRVRGPVLIASPPGCEVELPPQTPGRRMHLPRPRPLDQADAWRSLLGDAGGVHVDLLANRTHLTVAEIRKVTALAQQRAAVAGRGAATQADFLQALAESIPEPVSTLARCTKPLPVPWSSLVLDREAKSQLDDLIQRIEHRVTVQDRWKMGGAEEAGERAWWRLFHGDSGTGKTLAVEAIATRGIGLPLLPGRPSPASSASTSARPRSTCPPSSTPPRASAPRSSSTRQTPCSATAPASRTPTIATPTWRPTTCSRASRCSRAWRSWRRTSSRTWTPRSPGGSSSSCTSRGPRRRCSGSSGSRTCQGSSSGRTWIWTRWCASTIWSAARSATRR